MSDQQATGVVQAARAAHCVIPDDLSVLSVTGWDDAAVATELGLTTVAQSLRDQGALCAQAALGQRPSSRLRHGPSCGDAALGSSPWALTDYGTS